MLCFVLTTERVKFESDENEEKVSKVKNLGIILKNKALLAIIGAAIVLLLSMLMLQTVNQYLFADYFKDINALSISTLIALPINLILAAFIVKIANKLSSLSMFFMYGLYSFSRKIGQALAGGLGGFALTFIGYNSASAVQ